MRRTNANWLGRVIVILAALIAVAFAVTPLGSRAEKHPLTTIYREGYTDGWKNTLLGNLAPLIAVLPVPSNPPNTSSIAPGPHTPTSTPTITPAPSGGPNVMWQADHETGDLSQWAANE